MKTPHTLTFLVPSSQDGISLSRFLSEKGFSRKHLRKVKNTGISVNLHFHRLKDPLSGGDTVRVLFFEEEPNLQPNPTIKAPVLYEDEDLVVFDKPANLPVHPSNKSLDCSLGNLWACHYPMAAFRPVGRLDRNTSGLILVAKHQYSAGRLQKGIEKKYLALCQGTLPQSQGAYFEAISRCKGDQIHYCVDPGGLACETRYSVLGQWKEGALLELTLPTGRTHQIRVHLSHHGHPLFGDSLYGGSLERIKRHALHCSEMKFLHPSTGRLIHIETPLPQDMALLLEEIEQA